MFEKLKNWYKSHPGEAHLFAAVAGTAYATYVGNAEVHAYVQSIVARIPHAIVIVAAAISPPVMIYFRGKFQG